jgi:hypothetical protein
MNLDVRFDIPEGIKQLRIANGFPNLKAAVFDGGQRIIATWQKIAEERINRATGSYMMGIQKEPSITQDGWGCEVANTAKHARAIEYGHGGFSLPQKINWASTKGKIHHGKNGPYLIVPFRHMTPVKPGDEEDQGATIRHLKNSMPPEIYKFALGLTRSLDIPGDKQPMLNQATKRMNSTTLWGGRLVQVGNKLYAKEFHVDKPATMKLVGEFGKPGLFAGKQGLFESQKEHWTASKFAGMVKVGALRHTRYMIFRIITPHSTGWNIPAQAGKYIAQAVAESVAPTLEALFLDAIRKDITFE